MKVMMAENFDYFNAPQFYDFSKNTTEQENSDDYFEVDHESKKDPLSESHNSEDQSITSENDETLTEYRQNFRRSMSVGDLNYLKNACQYSEQIHKLRENMLENNGSNNGAKKGTLKKFGSYSSLNEQVEHSYDFKGRPSRSMSRESVNRLAQPKRHFSSDRNLNRKSYLPMAEALKKFHNSTPERFRTKPKTESFVNGNVPRKLTATIPQSPNLKTTRRARPVEVISREDQEKLEFDEAQKFKIKANPVNKKILQGPMKTTTQVQKKPSTVQEPFKLTAPVKKVPTSPKRNLPEFHARPVPKAVHEQPKLKAPLKAALTQPQAPSFMKRHYKSNETISKPEQSQPESNQAVRPRNTKPLPFSFELRDLHIKNKRQELVQKVIEEEKKAREFHAQPLPKSISQPLKNRSLPRAGSLKNLYSNSVDKSNENLPIQFKARPASVLNKKPFEPKKTEKPLIEISEFTLNTDIRSKEREAFEKQKKEKDERLEQYKQMEEVLRLQQEAEEVARSRKMAEVRAQPVKKYKSVTIQPSGKVTNPISPKFQTDIIRKNRSHDKENTQ